MNEDEKLIEALEYCTDIEHNCDEGCPYFTVPNCPTKMRRQALKLIKKLLQSKKEGNWVFVMYNPAYSPFDGGPSNFYKCSNCGYITGNLMNYCPQCGQYNKAGTYIKDEMEKKVTT